MLSPFFRLIPLVKSGHIRVEVDFDKASDKSITLIALITSQSCIQLDGNSKVTVDAF